MIDADELVTLVSDNKNYNFLYIRRLEEISLHW